MGAMLMNHEQHSQLVRKILQNYMAGDDLSAALALWQRQYQHQTLDKLPFFVFEITTTASMRRAKKELEAKLCAALQQVQLVQDNPPAQLKIVEAAKIEQAVSINAPVVDVQGLAFFLGQLLQALQAEDFQHVIEAVEIYIREENLSSDIGQELLCWLVERRQLNGIAGDEMYIRQVVTIMYSVLCDYWGPVKADRIMMQAIVQAEQRFPLLTLKQFL